MAKIKLDLVKFQNNYRVVAKVDGETISYKTTDESLAEDILNFARKIINVQVINTVESGETSQSPLPIFEVGETADGDYMILATIENEEFSLNVETKLETYEIFTFLNTIFDTLFEDDEE